LPAADAVVGNGSAAAGRTSPPGDPTDESRARPRRSTARLAARLARSRSPPECPSDPSEPAIHPSQCRAAEEDN
jgi:hypothetical protein